MRRSFFLALTVVLGLLVLGGCGTKAEIRYYQLALEQEAQPARGEAILSIDQLVGDAAYEDQRMVYRVSPYRLDYYYYHRWTSPPGILISDFLRVGYERTGHFKTVVTGFSPEAPVFLTGRVVAFEEIDVAEDRWIAHVALNLHLRDAMTGDIVWTSSIEENEPLESQTPEGLAEAMSRAMNRIVERTAPEFARIAELTRERNERMRRRERALDNIVPPQQQEQ